MTKKNQIKSQISLYLENKASKQDVHNWALEMMHKVLKEGVFAIENIEIWPIITRLVGIDSMDDIYRNELMNQIDQVLSGNLNKSFSFFIRIPEKVATNDLSQVKRILIQHRARTQLSKLDVSILRAATSQTFISPSSLIEILKMQILDLLSLGYDFYPDEEYIHFDLKHTIFISEDDPAELDYLGKIIALVDCYEGNKSFGVHVTFCNGIGYISMQI